MCAEHITDAAASCGGVVVATCCGPFECIVMAWFCRMYLEQMLKSNNVFLG
jgi:hypothetical protein